MLCSAQCFCMNSLVGGTVDYLEEPLYDFFCNKTQLLSFLVTLLAPQAPISCRSPLMWPYCQPVLFDWLLLPHFCGSEEGAEF